MLWTSSSSAWKKRPFAQQLACLLPWPPHQLHPGPDPSDVQSRHINVSIQKRCSFRKLGTQVVALKKYNILNTNRASKKKLNFLRFLEGELHGWIIPVMTFLRWTKIDHDNYWITIWGGGHDNYWFTNWQFVIIGCQHMSTYKKATDLSGVGSRPAPGCPRAVGTEQNFRPGLWPGRLIGRLE